MLNSHPHIRLDPVDGFPNFSEVSAATWRVLEACTADPVFIDDVFDVMLRTARSFHQHLAAPALALALRADPCLDTPTRDADADHLAGLLVALLRASFEAHTHAEFAGNK
jgi:hypothetical protein